MCNKGLRERHWESISEVIGYPFNLSTCRKLGCKGLNMGAFPLAVNSTCRRRTKQAR